MCGNTSEPGDAGADPGKSSLFFLTCIVASETAYPAKRKKAWQSTFVFDVSRAFATALENPGERFIRTLVRTHHRIRSPRLAASS